MFYRYVTIRFKQKYAIQFTEYYFLFKKVSWKYNNVSIAKKTKISKIEFDITASTSHQMGL